MGVKNFRVCSSQPAKFALNLKNFLIIQIKLNLILILLTLFKLNIFLCLISLNLIFENFSSFFEFGQLALKLLDDILFLRVNICRRNQTLPDRLKLVLRVRRIFTSCILGSFGEILSYQNCPGKWT